MSQSWSGWPSYQDYLGAKRLLATLTPKIYNGRLAGFTADIPGVVGGGSKASQTYKIYITLVNCPAYPPEVWITYPPDHLIRHRNIYHPGGGNPHVRLELPLMCLGEYGHKWSSGVLGRATNFLSFLLQIKDVLNNENPASPAR